MPHQKKNAGNEGDVLKHAALQRVVRDLSGSKSEFWYVETHAAFPYYFLPPEAHGGQEHGWQRGIGHLAQARREGRWIPELLTQYAEIAYHEDGQAHAAFPARRTYLGSTAQIFRVLRKEPQRRVRLTLFEICPEPAQELRRYFADQGAKTVLVRADDESLGWAERFLRKWWLGAVEPAGDEPVVMVVQGDAWQLAPSLWNDQNAPRPDLVFVDPFKLNDPPGEPENLLSSLNQRRVPFMCWTPLFRVPGQWDRAHWSFEADGRGKIGDKTARAFVEFCRRHRYQFASCCWDASAGARQKMYGCQQTFGNGVDTSAIWRLDGAEPDRGHDPPKPGAPWWDKYHVTVQP